MAAAGGCLVAIRTTLKLDIHDAQHMLCPHALLRMSQLQRVLSGFKKSTHAALSYLLMACHA